MHLKKNPRLNFVSHVRGKKICLHDSPHFYRFLFTLLRVHINQQHTLCNFLKRARLSELLDTLLRRQRILLRRVRFCTPVLRSSLTEAKVIYKSCD